MTDTFSKDERSAIMRAVRPSGNRSTELRLIDIFKQFSIRGWRRNYPLIGKPDFVFRNHRLAIFVDGCFWHGHKCRNTTPKANAAYWQSKLQRNKKRDLIVTRTLKQKGWTVVRVWECDLKNEQLPTNVKRLLNRTA